MVIAQNLNFYSKTFINFLLNLVEELPYINVPLHTIIKLTINGYKCKMEVIKLNIECVDTYRIQPKVCSFVV